MRAGEYFAFDLTGTLKGSCERLRQQNNDRHYQGRRPLIEMIEHEYFHKDDRKLMRQNNDLPPKPVHGASHYTELARH